MIPGCATNGGGRQCFTAYYRIQVSWEIGIVGLSNIFIDIYYVFAALDSIVCRFTQVHS